MRISSLPKLANAFWVRSVTLWPTTIATVSVETTSSRPDSEFAAHSVLKCIVGFHRQQREPMVVILGDGADERMLVGVTDLEVLALPARLDDHPWSSSVARCSVPGSLALFRCMVQRSKMLASTV